MPRRKQHVERVQTDLEIDEHLPMQEQGWKMQIAGLIFIFLLVFTAAIGLYGDGITSMKKVGSPDVTVEYERFYRHEARMELKIHATSISPGLQVAFPAEYLSHFQIDGIVPAPNENIFEGNLAQYNFKGNGAMFITFYMIPQETGNIKGFIQLNEDRFGINHFIFP